jgi:hypothetical protein
VLQELSPRARHGSRVTLLAAMDPADFEQHIERCRTALLRWAGHAEVPIHLSCFDEGAPGSERELAITTPLEIEAEIKLRARLSDGEVVLGCAAPELTGRTFAGFYNRGLTLFTQTDPLEGLEGVRFKLNSPLLGHTLSRDNVRRDAAFHALIDQVRALVRGELREEAARRLAAAAAGTDFAAAGRRKLPSSAARRSRTTATRARSR